MRCVASRLKFDRAPAGSRLILAVLCRAECSHHMLLLPCHVAVALIQKSLKTLVDCLRDDGEQYIRALDDASRSLSHASADSSQVDWATLITLALTCVHSLESSKSRTPGPLIELWQSVQYLFE